MKLNFLPTFATYLDEVAKKYALLINIVFVATAVVFDGT